MSISCGKPGSTIRKFRPDDADELVSVWESASALAHSFLSGAFLAQEKINLRTRHLRNADTWVLEQDGSPVGFIALIEDEIGGLFLDPSLHGLGLGRTLVDYAVGIRGRLDVEVFERNLAGCRFYDRYGFVEIGRYRHEASGEMTLRLTLPRDAIEKQSNGSR